MILPAARMRAWMMAALPVTALAGIFGRAGGAAAGMALWMALGVWTLRRVPALYPKQRRLGLPRLFFACAAGFAAVSGLPFLWVRLAGFPKSFGDRALLFAGSACFALTACEKALSRPLPRTLAWGLGSALCALFFCFLLGQ